MIYLIAFFSFTDQEHMSNDGTARWRLAFEVPWKSLLDDDELRNLFDLELSAVEAWEPENLSVFGSVFFTSFQAYLRLIVIYTYRPSLFIYSCIYIYCIYLIFMYKYKKGT